MRKKTAAVVLAVGIAGGGTAVVVAPGLAAAAASPSPSASSSSSSATDPGTDRLTAIKNALKGLVSDGTITQTQADKVATTLSQADIGGRGHHGFPAGGLTPEAIAKVLGITVDQLQTDRQAGKTLTVIAQSKGISKTDLVNRLVAAAKTQLAADVKAGRITQAQADDVSSGLTARITEEVDESHSGRGGHDSRGGHDGDVDGSTTAPQPPSSTPS